MIARALAVVAALATAPLDAGQVPEIATSSVRDDRFPTVEAAYPGGIVARPHVEFANLIGFRPLQLDLYLHRARGAPKPLILWVHGGGWSRGDARGSGAFADFPAVLAGLAARGYVVASVDYRLSGEARFPAQIQDVKAAIRYLRAHAGDYGIDPARVVVWGGSAGAHLSALTAVSCGVAAFDPPGSTGRLGRAAAAAVRPVSQSDCVQGAVLWYGPYDLTKIGDIATALTGCRHDCDAAKAAASPLRFVDRRTPPMLLIHGTADEEVGHAHSEAMAAAMKRAGARGELVLLPGIGHGFIGKTPAATRAAHLDALDHSIAFTDALTRSASGATAPSN